MTGVGERSLVIAAPLSVEAVAVRRGLGDVAVVRSGIRARRGSSVRAALSANRPAALGIVGVAGALVAGLRPGDVVVANEVRSPDGMRRCRSAPLLANALRRAGLTVHVGPIAEVDRVLVGTGEHGYLAAGGAIAVDMESGRLLGLAGEHPAAVVRVISDTPARPVWHPSIVTGGLTALSTLRSVGPVLRSWAAALGDRTVMLASPRSLRAVARESDVVLVAGSDNSSDSRRLVEGAAREGTPAHLVDDVGQIDLNWLAGARSVGISATASAPTEVVDEIIAAIAELGAVAIQTREVTTETVSFTLPKEVRLP